MTAEQKAWLDAHRGEYEPVGVTGGTTRYKDRGALEPNGTFVPRKIPRAGDPAILVGKLVVYDTGRPLDTRPARGGA